MDFDFKSQDGEWSENKIDEQSESSTTDDSSGVYPYYPTLDFPMSTRKIRSRLGKRRNTINPFRISIESTAADTNKSENNQDSLCTPVVKTDQKFTTFYLNDNNQMKKTPLKPATDNFLSGNATKVNQNLVHQPQSGKSLFSSKFSSDAAKENVPNSFESLNSSRKTREVFSASLQNEKHGSNTIKKFEAQNFLRTKSSETLSSIKSHGKASCLDDAPLDLKMKMKGEVKKEPETQRSRLNVDLDARDFINIFEMPSVKLTEETPPRPVYPSLNLQSSNLNAGRDLFKEPTAPLAKRQPNEVSPQETVETESYSVMDLSTDSCAKGLNQANSSISEVRNNQTNLLNTTDVNTASFVPNSNSSFIVEAESVMKRKGNDSSCLSSGSDGTGSSLSVGRKSNFERPTAGVTCRPKLNETLAPTQESAANPNLGPNTSLPAFQCNSNALFLAPNKSVSVHSKSDLPISREEISVNRDSEKVEKIPDSKVFPVSKPPVNTRALAQEIFKKPQTQIPPLKGFPTDPFKKPTQPSTMNGNSSSIPVPQITNSNFVLPKLNPRPQTQSKPTYSFESDVAKFCQKEGAKLTMLKSSQPPPPTNVQSIKVNKKSYHILSTIGRGGSSEVYQVLDPNSKSLLAVKVVKLASVDESIAEGYMNEVKLLEKLQGCSCVIRMFDYEYIEESKKLYVVMEKGDTDLSRLLKDINKTKKISMSMIIYYWTEMLTAVQEIHEKGIIHSDLKPANFLLVSGRLKLIDFGIASSIQGDMTSVHKDICAGTENYISPEAIQDGTGTSDKKYKISYKSDVWSLGCILYNLIYGKTPFSHITSRWGKMYAIISSSHKIEFPDRPMPPVLSHALQSCLIRDPKLRPTVKDLLDLPYHTPALPKDLPYKIQQILPEEWWQKIAHLFAEPVKLSGAQGK